MTLRAFRPALPASVLLALGALAAIAQVAPPVRFEGRLFAGVNEPNSEGCQNRTSGTKEQTHTTARPATEAARTMTVPEGFHVTVFAAEPDVRQPIAFTFDHRGRLWVAECYSYPEWSEKPPGEDRILIFEDRDGDGRFDRKTVFYDQGTNLSGLEVGFGGVWACSTPNLLFFPDRDGDDVPDGDPEVVLDGWNLKQAGHNVFNGLIWGPDGWLYGCNGIQSDSRVGRPGTPDEARVPINCGVWRYHPMRKVFEAVAHGTTNPWGLDFDDYGEAFITNCVIPHLYRVMRGAHFERMYGIDINRHAYTLMRTCADHVHWDASESWKDIRKLGVTPTTDRAGGGHAHVGALIYLGDNWPDEYRGSLYTCNLHGRRVNRDLLERQESGYVARHGPDFLLAQDEWFRGLALKTGPDGAVYLTDWSDTGECHESDADGAHRENGRIYRIAHGTPRAARVDLAVLDDAELVRLLLHKNDWYGRTARRLLQERAAAGKDMSGAIQDLRRMLETNGDVTRKLRAIWSLYAIGGLDEATRRMLLGHESEYVRGWAVRLCSDLGAPDDEVLEAFARMAREDSSAWVRLYLASALQVIPPPRRWPIAEALAMNGEDADDPSLPPMLWYGIEPAVPGDRGRAVALAAACRIPLVRRSIARRAVLADDESACADRPGTAALVAALEGVKDSATRRDLLDGMLDALRGRKDVAMPEGWRAAYDRLLDDGDAAVRERATLLALSFGDRRAAEGLTSFAKDRETDGEARRRALQALIDHRTEGLGPALIGFLDDPELSAIALRGLASYNDKATPEAILAHYPKLTPALQADAVRTLAARPDYAIALLDAVRSGKVPRRDLSESVARQLLAFRNPTIGKKLEEVWGALRATAEDKAALAAKYKALLTPERIKAADPSRGRSIFDRTCAQCHKLYGAGGDVGPELTGSDRSRLDYILENVLDPSALVGRDYRLTTVAMADGRLLTGIIRRQDGETVELQTENDRLVLARRDIEEMTVSNASMMPERLFEKLSDDEVADLVAYLSGTKQVPPEETPRGQ